MFTRREKKEVFSGIHQAFLHSLCRKLPVAKFRFVEAKISIRVEESMTGSVHVAEVGERPVFGYGLEPHDDRLGHEAG